MKTGSRVRVVAVILATLSGSVLGLGQTESQWEAIVGSKGDLNINFPSNSIIINEDNEYQIHAYLDGASLQVSKREVGNPKEYVKRINFPGSKNKSTLFEFNGFQVLQLIYEFEKYYSTNLYIGSSKNYYEISAFAKTSDNKTLVTFLSSIKLSGKTLFADLNSSLKVTTSPRILEKLQSNPIVKAALAKKCTGNIKYRYQPPSPDDKTSPASDQNPPAVNEYSRRLIILRKVKAFNSRGSFTGKTVRLRVLLQADGCVGEMVVVSGGKSDETMAAIRAASQIKFLPAEINGRPVDSVRTVEYAF